jgi:hypothetical protein
LGEGADTGAEFFDAVREAASPESILN